MVDPPNYSYYIPLCCHEVFLSILHVLDLQRIYRVSLIQHHSTT